MTTARKAWDVIKTEAADWALRSEASFSAPERAAFEAWRLADPRHDFAYQHALAACQDLRALSQIEELNGLAGVPTLRERAIGWSRLLPGLYWLAVRPQRRFGAAVAIGAAAALFVALMGPPVYETPVAELRAVTLDDGSVVTLGANSRLEMHFTASERRVTLDRGDAFFAVTKDASRPFVVTAGDTIVRVVGTKFDVRRGADDVRVAVVEGVVEVARPVPQAKADIHTLTAGQELIAARQGMRTETRVAKLAEPAAWRSGRLDYSSASLRQLIADANRYYAPGIELASDDLGDLQVTTSFRASQVDKMVESLADVLPLEASRRPDGRIILRARH